MAYHTRSKFNPDCPQQDGREIPPNSVVYGSRHCDKQSRIELLYAIATDPDMDFNERIHANNELETLQDCDDDDATEETP